MQKIDYGDLNKFLVSMGLVLIGLAALVPYFYLRGDYGIIIEQEKFNCLQEPIQSYLLEKQNVVINRKIGHSTRILSNPLREVRKETCRGREETLSSRSGERWLALEGAAFDFVLVSLLLSLMISLTTQAYECYFSLH